MGSSNMLYDIYAIGNALVDTEYEVTEAQLEAVGVTKRHMTLIDAERRTELLGHLSGLASHRTGGGSAGNTVVALAQLGGKAFYSCHVADDELGEFYVQDMAEHGVVTHIASTMSSVGQTGSCLVLVTPDAERSMCTFLGVSAELDHSALYPDAIVKSRVYYMEGYLAASPTGSAAAIQGRAMAQSAGVALAATLSDMSMINYCRANLDAMVGTPQTGWLDYLFCNEEEAEVWCGSQNMNDICQQLSKQARVVCITRSAKGCVVLEGAQQTEVPAVKVKAVDTNGAGDIFAGAFLYAVTQGHSHVQAAWLANQCASRVVTQYGNRLAQATMDSLKADFISQLSALS